MRRADNSSTGVLPTVVRRCVWSRILVNEVTLAQLGLSRQKTKTQVLVWRWWSDISSCWYCWVWSYIDQCLMLRFRREVDGHCVILSCYEESSGNYLPTFRDISLPFSNFKNPRGPLNLGPICCPETSARNYLYSLRNSSKERSLFIDCFLQTVECESSI